MGAAIMVGTLLGLIVLVFALVLRFDPEARQPAPGRAEATPVPEGDGAG